MVTQTATIYQCGQLKSILEGTAHKTLRQIDSKNWTVEGHFVLPKWSTEIRALSRGSHQSDSVAIIGILYSGAR